MTQKELQYYEDAIGHETNIIKICKEFINNLNNEELISFMKEEVSRHEKLKEELMNVLEGEINE